jgi:hypothetical protein
MFTTNRSIFKSVCIALLCIPLNLAAQDAALNIPATVLSVIRINPGPVSADLSLQQDMIRQINGILGKSNNDMLPFKSLNNKQKENATTFIQVISVDPASAGLGSNEPMYIIHDQNDTLSYTAFIYSLTDKQTFLNSCKALLLNDTFSLHTYQTQKITALSCGRTIAACSDKLAWLLFPDYSFPYSTTQAENRMNLSFWGKPNPMQYAKLMADSIMMVDSIMKAEMSQINAKDSAYLAAENGFQKTLDDNNFRLNDSIYSAVIKTREKKRNKGEILTTSPEQDKEAIINIFRKKYYVSHISKELLDKDTLKHIETYDYAFRDTYYTDLDSASLEALKKNPDFENSEWVVYPPLSALGFPNDLKYTPQTDTFVIRNMLTCIEKLESLDPLNSISTEIHFATTVRSNSDAVYFYNIDKILEKRWQQQLSVNNLDYVLLSSINQNSLSNDSLAILNKKTKQIADSLYGTTLWKASGMCGTANFEQNKFEIDHQLFFNSNVTSTYKGMFGGKVSNDLLNYIKASPLSVMSISFDPEKLVDFGVRGIDEYITLINTTINQQQSPYDSYYPFYQTIITIWRMLITKDQLREMFDGELIFAITDLVVRNYTYETFEFDANENFPVMVQKTDSRITPEFVLAAKINNTERVNEMLNTARISGLATPFRGGYKVNLNSYQWRLGQAYIFLSGKNLVFTNDSLMAYSYYKNGYPKNLSLSKADRKTLRKSPVSGWTDAERTKLLEHQRKSNTDNGQAGMVPVTKGRLGKLVFYGKRGANGMPVLHISGHTTGETIPDNGFMKFYRAIQVIRIIYPKGL